MSHDVLATRRFVEAICARWQDSVSAILDVGRLLIEARQSLPHGEWSALFADASLPFGERTAQRLMAIAAHPSLSDPTHVSVLPPSWGTLYELTRLSDATVEAAIKDGRIRPDMGRSEVTALRQEKNRVGSVPSLDTCTTEDLNCLIERGDRFGTIYADPPWVYDNQATRAAQGNHYGGLTVEQLCELPVRDLAADDAHLHLWTTNAFLFDCKRIFDAWGFEFRSSFVWVKPQMGIGNYWRNSHEFLLTAIRGDAKRFNDRSLKSWLECDRSRHSEKPFVIREFIRRASPGPYLEMFARTPADGWTCWGNEIERGLLFPHAEELA